MSTATGTFSSVPKEPNTALWSLAESEELEYKIVNDRRALVDLSVQEKEGDGKENNGLKSAQCKGPEADANKSLKQQIEKEKVREAPSSHPPSLFFHSILPLSLIMSVWFEYY